jgi:hypothetical protein
MDVAASAYNDPECASLIEVYQKYKGSTDVHICELSAEDWSLHEMLEEMLGVSAWGDDREARINVILSYGGDGWVSDAEKGVFKEYDMPIRAI